MSGKQYPIPSKQRTNTARTLRQDSTFPERLLWGALRNRGLGGLKFRRQKPAGAFFTDFYCHEAKLVVELDGMSHVEPDNTDDKRTEILERDGLRVIRFTNDDVLRDLEAVCETILREAGR